MLKEIKNGESEELVGNLEVNSLFREHQLKLEKINRLFYTLHLKSQCHVAYGDEVDEASKELSKFKPEIRNIISEINTLESNFRKIADKYWDLCKDKLK